MSYSISDYLLAQHGTMIRPGCKARCPFCDSRGKPLSLKRDDTLAKCFRCGVFVLYTERGIYDSSQHSRRAA